jgi:hypothetical protein
MYWIRVNESRRDRRRPVPDQDEALIFDSGVQYNMLEKWAEMLGQLTEKGAVRTAGGSGTRVNKVRTEGPLPKGTGPFSVCGKRRGSVVG